MKNVSMRKFVVMGLLATTMMFPASVSAFWPFDSGNGDVKGAQTPQQGGFSGFLQRIWSSFSGGSGPSGATGTMPEYRFGPSGATGARGMLDPKTWLDQAVINGKITQAQENEILSRLAAIKAKQQELMTLEKSLNDWLKANNLSPSLLEGPPRGVFQGATRTEGTRSGVRFMRPTRYPTFGQMQQ